MFSRIISQGTKLAFVTFVIPFFCFSSQLQLIGTINAIGSSPFVKTALYTSQSQRYVISGPFETELKNLQGTTVKVKGRLNGTDIRNQLPIFEVTEYKLLTVGEGANARTPWVGILSGHNPLYLQTEDGKQIFLKGPLVSILSKYRGSKLWLTGPKHSSGFFFWKKTFVNPTAFGIIRLNKNNNPLK